MGLTEDIEEIYPGFDRINMVGEKVRLRPVKAADAHEAYLLVKNDAVLSTIAWEGPTDEAELRETYRRWNRDTRSGQSHNLTIESIDKSGLIGCIGVRFPHHRLQADIGYWLGEPFWNRGYMTDAVRLICYFAFQHLDAQRAYATVLAGNTGSRRVLENNGFSLDGTLRHHINKNGKWLDGWFFSILRPEWQARREEYEPSYEEIVVRQD